jgi:SpoIID/LytB domain protein
MFAQIAILVLTQFGSWEQISWAGAHPSNPNLQIGIVQRFGENPQDRLVIRSANGESLVLEFTADGKNTQTVSVPEVTVGIELQPLPVPEIEEKVVISHHRSFENAAATAYRLQGLGVQTEIAQPRRWQVWAKRSVYNSPILRSLLVLSLQAQGMPNVQIERRVISQKPVLTWQVGKVRYQRQVLHLRARGDRLWVNDRLYGGSLRLQPNAYGTYTLVNIVPLETYLRGVVPHEIGYQAPYAAVQAQAVLARTYVLANRQRFAVDNYELCADTHCQVYKGLQDTSPIADQAIADTQGQVLTYQGRLIDALYSSTTGGITANFTDVWDGAPRPYLQAVIDMVNPPFSLAELHLSSETNFRNFLAQRQNLPFNEQGWRTFSWQKDSSLAEIRSSLLAFLQEAGDRQTQFSRINSLRVSERAPSGRVSQLTVSTDRGEITIRKDEIIDAFTAPNSLFFYVQPLVAEDGKTLTGYRFIGGGLGHGLGMSQTGAYRLARMGWSYQQILAFYYRGTKLQTLGRDAIAYEPQP